MKKILIIFLFVISWTLIFSQNSASSFSYAGSYQTRAKSYEANYWNPATLYFSEENGFYWNMFNFNFAINNDAFSIKKYNEINGDSLSTSDKNDILNTINGAWNINLLSNIFMGFSWNKKSITTGFNLISKNEFSDNYFELLLFGNEKQIENDNYIYNFTKDNNNLNALSYIDLTYGSGNFALDDYLEKLKLKEDFVDISFGYAISALIGIGSVETDKFKAQFSSSEETGISFNQEILLKQGLMGIGTKLKFGVAAEKNNIFLNSDNLKASLIFDNVIGAIKWVGKAEEKIITIQVDSLYISDLENDTFENDVETKSITNYSTNLPFMLGMAVQYDYKLYSASLDYKQYVQKSYLYSNKPQISFGWDIRPLPKLLLKNGIGFGNNDNPYTIAYGISYEGEKNTFDFAVQSFKSFFPGSSSHGLSLAISNTWRF